MIVKEYASDSGHWYFQDGTPAYTIIGKNGKERNTTLRDAREHSLVPSVTTILKVAASPGLERWKQDQILMAALTLPKMEGENEFDYIARIRQDAQEQGRKAADRGTEIHGLLEKWFMTPDCRIIKDLTTEEFDICFSTNQEIDKWFNDQNWMPEKSFAHPIGFAGKVDLHSPEVVVDFKTKSFDADNLPKAYDDHVLQLAAYREGLGYPKARCANVFVSVSVPGLVHIFEHSAEELERGLKMFLCLLDYWKIKNKYGC